MADKIVLISQTEVDSTRMDKQRFVQLKLVKYGIPAILDSCGSLNVVHGVLSQTYDDNARAYVYKWQDTDNEVPING